jgi:hypothetical protein
MHDYTPKFVPAKTNGGWPIAGLVWLLAFALIAMVVVIHNRTYKHPTDPTWHSVNGARPANTADAPAPQH